MLSRKEYLDRFPKKYISVGGVILDNTGKFLIVKPTYKDLWLLPGGGSDANETFQETCIREVKEETGLLVKTERLLTIIYLEKPDPQLEGEVRNEFVNFVFYCGKISESDKKTITLPKDELSDYKFVDFKEATKLLQRGIIGAPIIEEALLENTTIYKEIIEK